MSWQFKKIVDAMGSSIDYSKQEVGAASTWEIVLGAI